MSEDDDNKNNQLLTFLGTVSFTYVEIMKQHNVN